MPYLAGSELELAGSAPILEKYQVFSSCLHCKACEFPSSVPGVESDDEVGAERSHIWKLCKKIKSGMCRWRSS